MHISRSQIESYFFGNPQLIAAKILFIKRVARLEEYQQHLLQVQELERCGTALLDGCVEKWSPSL